MFLKKDEILFYGETEIRIKIRRNIEDGSVSPLARQAALNSRCSIKLWSLSTSKASRRPQKRNIRPEPLVKLLSSAVWSNQSEWRSSSVGSRWDCHLFPSSPKCRCNLFVKIINIMNIIIISTIITNSTASQSLSLISDNATPSCDSTSNRPRHWIHLQVVVDVLGSPRLGALNFQRRRGAGPSRQGEILIKVIDRKDQLDCCQDLDLLPLTHPQELDGIFFQIFFSHSPPLPSPGSLYVLVWYYSSSVRCPIIGSTVCQFVRPSCL